MRQSMLRTLATHRGVADMNVVESWIREQGFPDKMLLSREEAEEVARQVHEEVEKVVSHAEAQEEREEKSDRESGEENP